MSQSNYPLRYKLDLCV